MKNSALKVIVIMLMMSMCVMLTGRSATQLSFRKVNADYTTGKLKLFVKKNITKEGAYLYKENKRTMYLLLNENKKQKDSDEYLSKVMVTPQGDTINISYDLDKEATTSIKVGKKINKVLYRIRLHKNFGSVRLFRNGKEIKPSQAL